MNITGRVFDQFKRTKSGGYEGIPSVKVYISNAEGEITPMKKYAITDQNGSYTLKVDTVPLATPAGTIAVPAVDGKFITANFGGLSRTLPLTMTNKYDFDLGMKEGVQEIIETTVTAPKYVADKKIKAWPFIVGGILIIAGLGTYFLTKKQ